MKKFNLERALAGEPVVTRNGKKVTELHLFKNETLIQPLYGTVEGDDDVFSWTTFGIYNPGKETSWDLFMAGEKKSVWVNVYKNDFIDEFDLGMQHTTLERATNNIRDNENYIKTIEITNEP
jgi:hypothetical protein